MAICKRQPRRLTKGTERPASILCRVKSVDQMSSIAKSLTCVVVFGVAGAGAVHAQANCEMYGRLTLKQMQENEQKKCGFKGPEWSSDLKAHVAWCGTVGPDLWKMQLQKREQALAACGRKP